MSSSGPKVLIVGAGPSGLVAALTLLQNGVSVRIIDKDLSYRIGQRGSGITPRSMELFYFLGVKEILQQSIFSFTVRKHMGGSEPDQLFQMMQWADPTPSCPWGSFLMMGQDHTERILRSHLEKYGCRVELGTKLRSFEQYPDHVTADLVITHDGQDITEIMDYDWVVGADGARGIVRKALGLTFLGETREEEQFTTGDIHLGALTTDTWHTWGDVTNKTVHFKPTENEGSDVFQFFAYGREVDHAKINSSATNLIEFFINVTGLPTEAFGEVVWVADFRPNIRMVSKFGEGRVFVVGDAAHVHSPLGAQGMNSSIQDAFNLAWKLALVCKSLSPSNLLSSYNSERLPIIAQMLNISTELHNKNFKANDQNAWERGANLLQLGVNYRGSDIIVDEAKGSEGEVNVNSYSVDGFLKGGDRAPDAPALINLKANDGTSTRLFDIFKPQYHTALIFLHRDGVEQSIPVLQGLQQYPAVRSVILHPQGTEQFASSAFADFVLKDLEGHAYQAYTVSSHAPAITIYIVRPDGVIGGLVHGVEGVGKYFSRIYA